LNSQTQVSPSSEPLVKEKDPSGLSSGESTSFVRLMRISLIRLNHCFSPFTEPLVKEKDPSSDLSSGESDQFVSNHRAPEEYNPHPSCQVLRAVFVSFMMGTDELEI
jgi:hypothetical protein